MHKHAEVLRAIADGKDVQWKGFSTGEWHDVAYGAKVNPVIDTHLEWRIKPEPKPSYVVRGKVNCDQDLGTWGRGWQFFVNVTIDGDTDRPISVELLK